METIIDREYLQSNPDHIFVFGDNNFRAGHGGAAILRHEPNTYGFITKKRPDHMDSSFYRPGEEFDNVLDHEMRQLKAKIILCPDKKFLISRLGGGLANRYGIFDIIVKRLAELKEFPNVEFLFELPSS